MIKYLKNALLVISILILASCSPSEDVDDWGGNPDYNPASRVKWSSIPSDFNPSVEEVGYLFENKVDRVYLNIHYFDSDIEVIYTADLPEDSMSLRVFKVSHGAVKWNSLSPRNENRNLIIHPAGEYNCSISTVDGEISGLAGGCYLRMQVFLPEGSKVVVYNLGQQISKL